MAELVVEALALSISNITHYNSRMSTYLSDGLISAFIQSSAIGMKADYAEANPLMVDLVGGYEYQIEKTVDVLQTFGFDRPGTATVLSSPAQELPLPDASADALITDPPYYYSIPYADLSDLFYGWLRRFLFREELSFMSGIDTPKQKEASQSLPHSKSPSSKDSAHYENALTESFGRARRIVAPHGVGVIVFAHTETSAWESLLSGILQSGWVVTGSWPIDTENRSRMLANRQRSLSSSVHLVVRPREFSDGSLDESSVGDWRDVLGELPVRIRAWLPRLAAEGVVGADAIFACLGPALEIYSKYARVEKASGEVVTLREYLEQVWAAVSREALSMVFENADATGFEEDARLTAMFLWTLAAGVNSDGNGEAAKAARSGFSLEYDAARKIAQGLGAHLEQMSGVVEVKGETARLLPVTERVRFLFGKDAEVSSGGGSRGSQGSLFEELAEIEGGSGLSGRVSVPSPGETTLDQVHQAMILFGTNQTEALRQFLVDDWVGKYGRFWSLAQALAALYPQGSDERRWVEGVLARKTPLGL